MAKVTINGIEVVAAIDPLAFISMVTPEFREKCEMKASVATIQLRGIGNGKFTMTRSAKVGLKGEEYGATFAIVPRLPFDVVVGLDILARSPIYQKFKEEMESDIVMEHTAMLAAGECNKEEVKSGKSSEEIIEDKIAHLSQEVRVSVLEICGKYPDVCNESRANTYKGEPVVIELKDDRPIKFKLRPVSPKLKKPIESQIEELLKNGMIRKSKSAWAAPVHCVPKKAAGEWRLVVDYRELNKRIVADSYPIPRMMDILYDVQGCKYYIIVDVEWGFYNIGIRESCKHLTAFICHLGLFEFNVMPMGLKNSPAEFQRIIDAALGYMDSAKVKVYIDDIVIAADSEGEALDAFEEVLKRLSAAGLRIKVKKLEMLQSSVKLLGHVVSENGIEVDKDRIVALRKMRTPKNKDELKSFLGTVAYMKLFIPNYSLRVAKLSALLKKNVVFKWDDEHQQTYDEVIAMMEEGATLVTPVGTGSYVMVTDASNVAVGVALLCYQNNDLQLIAFYSQTLSDTQRNWDTRERELYAIKYGLGKCYELIKGHHVFVLTDHKSLQWLDAVEQSKIQRWKWYLNQFDLTIIHIAGKLNVIADWLSRCGDNDAEEEELLDQVSLPIMVAINEHVRIPSLEELKQAQRNICEEDKKEVYLNEEGFYVSVRSHKFYVPEEYRRAFLFWVHSVRTSAHRGIGATRKKLSKIAYWPGLSKDVEKYVKSCWVCERTKKSNAPQVRGVLQRPYAFELISVDYVGPRIINSVKYWYLVIIDHCTRFMVTTVTINANGDFAGRCLRDLWVPYFSAPRVVLSDNAFGESFNEYVNGVGAIQMKTSAYYPQGNGINERSHGLLEKGIAAEMTVTGIHVDYVSIVRDVTMAYNHSFHSAVGETPYNAVYGKDPVFPGFQEYVKRKGEDERLEYLDQRKQVALQRYNYAISNVQHVEKVEVGDLVIFERSEHEMDKRRKIIADTGLAFKYNPRWSLPCRVLKIVDKSITVGEMCTRDIVKVPLSRVKRLVYPVDADQQLMNWSNIMRTLPPKLRQNGEALKDIEDLFPNVKFVKESDGGVAGPSKRLREEDV
eukprot:Pgem_evm2s6513